MPIYKAQVPLQHLHSLPAVQQQHRWKLSKYSAILTGNQDLCDHTSYAKVGMGRARVSNHVCLIQSIFCTAKNS